MSFDDRRIVETAARHALRRWRSASKLTQYALSKQLGLSSSAINHIEAGRALPTLKTAIDLEEIAGIPCRDWKQIDVTTRGEIVAALLDADESQATS